VSGAVATKAARLVDPGEPVEISGPPPRFVGRGGEKLDAALDRFAISVEGCRAVDAGASTGGFTDVLLQRGAARVVAIDVGRNQLHERLRADPRVDSRERTNIRGVRAEDVGGAVPIVVADLSFISLRSVADALLGLVADGGDLVLLVKPQFEAAKVEASKGRGVISDPAVWHRVLDEVCGALRRRGAAIMGLMVSPLRGADGNVEFLLHARARGPMPGPVDDAAIAAVVAGVVVADAAVDRAEGPR
jgi:23S rRNA (cytidine1920-2'-O)/16S rRNA (cytidine1409-2'-O)-methyltransferase